MAEREAQRDKEAEARIELKSEQSMAKAARAVRRALEGRVVIKGGSRPWERARQGLLKYYVDPHNDGTSLDDPAVTGWCFFIHDVRTHSGKHRHQGGLCIYVVEGKGWTVVDGVRCDWEEGDLILLPIKPGGVEHQHFNAEPGKPCKWLAMIYWAYREALGSLIEQVENSPVWKEQP